MTVVYFVRHAHSTYSEDEYNRPLSLKGLHDAHRITDRLKNEEIAAVLSSPYKRAIETVQGIADWNGKKIFIFDELKERTLAEGALEDFEAAINHVWDNPSFALEGGESNLDVQQRALPIFHAILSKYANSQIIIGTHGNIMTLLLNAFDPSIGLSFWRELKKPDIIKAEFNELKLVGLEKINF